MFFDALNQRYADLRTDEPTWRALVVERGELDGALADRVARDDAR